MKNKILIQVEVPMIEKTYDLYIPVNKKVGTIKRLIEEAVQEITGSKTRSKIRNK